MNMFRMCERVRRTVQIRTTQYKCDTASVNRSSTPVRCLQYASVRVHPRRAASVPRILAGNHIEGKCVCLREHRVQVRSEDACRRWCASADGACGVACSGHALIPVWLNLMFVQRAALENIAKVLKAAGCGLEHIVKANVYLTDMNNFGPMNEVYAQVRRSTR